MNSLATNPMLCKSEALKKFLNFKTLVEKQFNHLITIIRSNMWVNIKMTCSTQIFIPMVSYINSTTHIHQNKTA